ncbi:uncharacterized protein LOC113464032 [Ceratina calcarata]|uniref:Uncharacterized protein LOC113464032 n=1 Tax=Ceratina calcarata TaxID=156304 RepID=A0AAJ7RXC5_9HYME|nr:uncharacterized protein LOC113464032 [Ceratina calcarata]
MVKLLLDYDANVNARDKNHVTPVHDAVQNGDREMVELFLANGAVLSDQPELLFTAVAHGYKEIARLLLKQGVDVNFRDPHGRTPLHVAVSNLRDEAHKTSSEDDLRTTSEITDILLEHNSDINSADNRGTTPVLLCAMSGRVDPYMSLVQKGANIRPKLNDGSTILHLTIRRRRTDINLIKILVNSGADINCLDLHGDTPLHTAVRYRNMEAARLLIERKANVNAKSINGSTPLHLTAYHAFTGMEDICRLLVERGADVNARRNRGDTALHIAAKKGFLDVVDLLCSSGADTDTPNRRGDTALHLASQERRKAVVRSLIAHDSDVNLKNNTNKTPFKPVLVYDLRLRF